MDEQIRAALAKGGVIDITTTGRKSGEARRIEIVFHNIGGHLYISGFPREQKRNWLANLEKHPDFTFHLKASSALGVSADLAARARSITSPEERRAVMTQVAKVWGRDDLDEMVRIAPLVEVTIADQ